LGNTTGMIELINEFVMLEDRPVIFIGLGIWKSESKAIRGAPTKEGNG